jgi:hypothetical protein
MPDASELIDKYYGAFNGRDWKAYEQVLDPTESMPVERRNASAKSQAWR